MKENIKHKQDWSVLRDIQIAGWNVLTTFLNGSVGKIALLYPFSTQTSKALDIAAADLLKKWVTLQPNALQELKRFSSKSKVANIISLHYYFLELQIDRIAPNFSTPIEVSSKRTNLPSQAIKITKSIGKLGKLIHSYWLHGSLGSDEIKDHWSDYDGLIILSKDAIANPNNLIRIRQTTIRSKSAMISFMPFQLHGHFILSVIDLHHLISPMFPVELFQQAQCVHSNSPRLDATVIQDYKFAKDTLWHHGIQDLKRQSKIENTTSKILLLHRIYLLPCLVSQTNGIPKFKKEAFNSLSELFPEDEVAFFIKAQDIWTNWNPPNLSTILLSKVPLLFRYNPLLLSTFSHRFCSKLDWFENCKKIDWKNLQLEASKVAESIWKRTEEAEHA